MGKSFRKGGKAAKSSVRREEVRSERINARKLLKEGEFEKLDEVKRVSARSKWDEGSYR